MTTLEAIAVPPQPSVPAVPPADTGAVRFLGRERVYWRLLIRGAVLLMVTLGIYRFWLATDMRRFLWTNTEIAGDTLEYVGTAREILLGFLIAIALLVPLNVVFFIAGFSILGGWSAMIGFVVLTWFGQFAIYRARRYRLTRTIFRGIRFHQSGAAWRYAFRALIWWTVTILTLGLAYPFATASLERYKMRNTYYGDLPARFDGSGFGLFFRGLLLWLIVIGPCIVGIAAAIGQIDWQALAAAFAAGADGVMSRIESRNPNFGTAIVIAVLAFLWVVFAAALLYPAFQAITLRWWISGLRFGGLTVASRLRISHVYAVYLRFLGIGILFGCATSAIGVIGVMIFERFASLDNAPPWLELLTAGAGVVAYVVVMLGYSTIYQATVRLRLWRLGFETAQLRGLGSLANVKARGAPSSGFGEGLADALNVGGF